MKIIPILEEGENKEETDDELFFFSALDDEFDKQQFKHFKYDKQEVTEVIAAEPFDHGPVIQGVLYSRSLRSSFSVLGLYPVHNDQLRQHPDELSSSRNHHSTINDDVDKDQSKHADGCSLYEEDFEEDPVLVRIQFGPQPEQEESPSSVCHVQDTNNNNKNLVPFLRSQIRRFYKMGDLIRVQGGKWLANSDGAEHDEDEISRYVLTLRTLKEAETKIQVLERRWWNIRQLQICQNLFIPQPPPLAAAKSKPSSRSTLDKEEAKELSSVREKRPRRSKHLLPLDNQISGENVHGASKNTSLTKRIQASCVANFLMQAIAAAMETHLADTTVPVQEWASKPLTDPTHVQEYLNRDKGVLDIAGGSGYLSMALGLRGVRSTVVDPRRNVGKLPKRDRKLLHTAPLKPSTLQAQQISQERMEHVWQNLLFPASSSPPKTPTLPVLMNQVAQVPTPLDLHQLIRETDFSRYYCQPVKQFDSYRAWFGQLPPDMEYAKLKDPETESLPVCDDQDECLQHASALVALHPDEATDALVDMAVTQGIPFVVVPCCVFSRLFPHRRLPLNREGGDGLVRSLSDLLDYLQAKHPSIQRATLPFEGANTVVWSTFGLQREIKRDKSNRS